MTTKIFPPLEIKSNGVLLCMGVVHGKRVVATTGGFYILREKEDGWDFISRERSTIDMENLVIGQKIILSMGP